MKLNSVKRQYAYLLQGEKKGKEKLKQNEVGSPLLKQG